MDLAPYIEKLREELVVSASGGGDDIRALAQRLVAPLESSVRLVLLDALSAAADEITRDLAPGSVDLRLRGLEPSFVVSPPPDAAPDDAGMRQVDVAGAGAESGVRPPTGPGGDDGATSRINLRVPESLKAWIEEAARQERLSVNAWLVRAVTATLESDDHGRRAERRAPHSGQRLTGWVR